MPQVSACCTRVQVTLQDSAFATPPTKATKAGVSIPVDVIGSHRAASHWQGQLVDVIGSPRKATVRSSAVDSPESVVTRSPASPPGTPPPQRPMDSKAVVCTSLAGPCSALMIPGCVCHAETETALCDGCVVLWLPAAR